MFKSENVMLDIYQMIHLFTRKQQILRRTRLLKNLVLRLPKEICQSENDLWRLPHLLVKWKPLYLLQRKKWKVLLNSRRQRKWRNKIILTIDMCHMYQLFDYIVLLLCSGAIWIKYISHPKFILSHRTKFNIIPAMLFLCFPAYRRV